MDGLCVRDGLAGIAGLAGLAGLSGLSDDLFCFSSGLSCFSGTGEGLGSSTIVTGIILGGSSTGLGAGAGVGAGGST